MHLASRSAAQAQQAGKLFFEGDIVRGAQAGAPGPFCVLANQFRRLEKVVWRLRILDQAGNNLDGKGLKSVVIELPDGQKMDARFGPHPPPSQGPATDYFWTAIWIIPESYPSGTFAYKVTATDMQGQSQTLAAVHADAVAAHGGRRRDRDQEAGTQEVRDIP